MRRLLALVAAAALLLAGCTPDPEPAPPRSPPRPSRFPTPAGPASRRSARTGTGTATSSSCRTCGSSGLRRFLDPLVFAYHMQTTAINLLGKLCSILIQLGECDIAQCSNAGTNLRQNSNCTFTL